MMLWLVDVGSEGTCRDIVYVHTKVCAVLLGVTTGTSQVCCFAVN